MRACIHGISVPAHLLCLGLCNAAQVLLPAEVRAHTRVRAQLPYPVPQPYP